jgi:hypothetical protein
MPVPAAASGAGVYLTGLPSNPEVTSKKEFENEKLDLGGKRHSREIAVCWRCS